MNARRVTRRILGAGFAVALLASAVPCPANAE